MTDIKVEKINDACRGCFDAMASQCELLIDTTDLALATRITKIAQREALRIQKKFSRYVEGNPVWQINHSNGLPVEVDTETALLLDFAQTCYELSDGLFDITSGCLRRVWSFHEKAKTPSQEAIAALLPHVGWDKVKWQNPFITLPEYMEIDFGGLGKEYAVDRSLLLIQESFSCPVLVNYGGDLVVSGPRVSGQAWNVGIERPDAAAHSDYTLEIQQGALATSGDAKRFFIEQGIRYAHILNPKTGWPIQQAPRSVTVAGANCIQAGILATFALLKGDQAEHFLTEQKVPFWCLR